MNDPAVAEASRQNGGFLPPDIHSLERSLMELSVAHEFLPKALSSHAAIVMDHFGIGFETGRHTIAERFSLPLAPGQIACFTGPSGSGKSSLMRAAAAQLSDAVSLDEQPLGDRILIDAIPLPPAESMPLLAACGLSEARLLLRTPAELSDGQRYRFRLALALARRPKWIIADEFTAALDRTLARVIAFNIRRLADRSNVGFLLATTHEDILDDLSPDHHVRCFLNAPPTLAERAAPPERIEPAGRSAASETSPEAQKKSRCRSSPASSSRPDRNATTRTSLGGIIAPIISESSAG